MEKLEKLFYWFDNSVFVNDHDRDKTLIREHTNHVKEKKYFDSENERIFLAWDDINPVKTYNRQAFYNIAVMNCREE